MNGKKITTGTWLPVFPGFYETIFDGEMIYENEEDYIRETIKPVELADCMIENMCNSNAGTKLWKDYTRSIAEQCVDCIEKELKALRFVEKLEFEEISSPKYYNYINDSINIQVTFSAENVRAIRNFIFENLEAWKTYLKENYTSCDGFISFHKSTPDSEEWVVDSALNDSHNAGAVLEFLCGENDIDQETLYYFCENNVQIDIKELRKECISSGWYEPKRICRDWFVSLLPRLGKYYSVRTLKDRHGIQFIFETPKQRYFFAITKDQITNEAFIVKRFFKILVFARLKNGKKR